jgi:hypothetical protein
VYVLKPIVGLPVTLYNCGLLKSFWGIKELWSVDSQVDSLGTSLKWEKCSLMRLAGHNVVPSGNLILDV